MNAEQVADRIEIQKNVWDYANAVDLKAFDGLRELFVDGGTITYGRKARSVPDAIAWLKEQFAKPSIRGYCHMMGNMWIDIRGDAARTMTRCLNPMEFIQADGQVQLWFNGIWYYWTHQRTTGGWRLSAGGPHAENFDAPNGRKPKHFGWSTPPYPPVRPSPLTQPH
ncbi:MAG TPA: nuclear transport factor 2 family protein [Alphaproteobacteria bacterium]|nr:nuclear transport factor 2 family protein [Alphaproteobacteria bacterium]